MPNSFRLILNSASSEKVSPSSLTRAGKVMLRETPRRFRFPVTVWEAPPSPPTLTSVDSKVALGNFSTSKKSGDFRCPVSFSASV